MLKKPVNGGDDITKSGDQPSGINEGIIYAGIFEEDSTGGVVTKSLNNATAAAAAPASNAAAGAGCKQRRAARGQMGHGLKEVKMI